MEWVASRVKKAPGSESGLSLVIDYPKPRAIKNSILEAETPISTSEKLWSSHAQQYRISCTHQENTFFVMAFFIPPSCKFWMFVSRRMPSKSLLVASPFRMAFSLCLWESCPPLLLDLHHPHVLLGWKTLYWNKIEWAGWSRKMA